MTKLSNQECEPCKGGIPALTELEYRPYLDKLDKDWKVIDHHHLQKQFNFKNFVDALAFANKVGIIAENQGHHPDIHLSWGKVVILIWTHKIDGLHKSDFILAAKIDSDFYSN